MACNVLYLNPGVLFSMYSSFTAVSARVLRHRNVLLSSAMLAIVAMPAAVHAQGGASTQRAALRFDVPAQPLDTALTAVADQGGVQIILMSEGIAGIRSAGVTGPMTVEEALSRALTGSGFGWRYREQRVVMIEKLPDSQGAVQLGAVRVEAGGAAGGTAGAAYAATSDPASTEGTGSYTTRSMGTATKMALSIRETPQAVTVISRQRLDDQVMTSITDVVQYAPGLFLSNADGPGRPSFQARGLSVDNIMYDGLPMRFQGWVVGSMANMALFDRVEVVRGATGLVTGSGNPSAAINLVRKRPTRDFQIKGELGAGSWDNYRGEIDMSGPVDDDGHLRTRVVGSYRNSGTFRNGEKVKLGVFHNITEYDLGPDTMLMAGYTHQDDSYNVFWGGLPVSATGEHLNLPRSFKPSYDWEIKQQKSDTLFGELSHNFGRDWKLRLAGMKVWQDAIFSGTTIVRNADNSLTHNAYQATYDEDQVGLDAYLSGPLKLFGRDHDVTLGASHRSAMLRTQNYSGGGLIPGTIDLDTFDPSADTKPNFVATTFSKAITSQQGIYGSIRLNPADMLKVILGGRVDWLDYDNKTGSGDYRIKANKTFYAGVILDIDRHHSVYGSFTDIFQPQSTLSFAPTTSEQAVLKPIVGKNYEAGVKGEYFDGQLNAAIALFRIDQTNRAFVPIDQTGCPTFPASNCAVAAGLVRSKGIDAEIQGALTPDWQISAGYTYTSIRYVKDTNPDNQGRNFSTYQPLHIAKLMTSYNFGDLRIGGGVTWQSRIYQQRNGYRNQQNAYAIANLFGGYRFSEHADLQVNLNNIFDKTYYRMVGNPSSPYDTYGEPRSVLATLRVKY
jgi:outer membrane receptor for ferric coprogen and ferric-rhodotorulic acid